MIIKIQKPKGTRDFSPEEMKTRRKVEEQMRRICRGWGYEEVHTPTFETLDLFELKSGEEIIEEIYGFEDKSGRELVLRPEITASIMRFYSNELRANPKPLKLFYFGNCFRYEQPQRGRYREFWQFGTEVIGGEVKYIEPEIISLANDILCSLGLSFELKIGNIGILRQLMDHYGVSLDKQNKALSVIDSGDDVDSELKELDLPDDLIRKLIKLKNSDSPLKEAKNQFDDISEHSNQLEEFKKTISYLEDFGVKEYEIDLSVTRGLDYYMGTVFEMYAKGLGAQNQICGGGTYKFPELLQGNIASSGFGLGFDRIIDAIKSQRIEIELEPRAEAYVAPLSDEFRSQAISVTKELRKELSVEMDLKGRGIGDQLSFANRLNIPYVVIIGEEEVKEDAVTLKNMDSGEQNTMGLNEAIIKMKKGLDKEED